MARRTNRRGKASVKAITLKREASVLEIAVKKACSENMRDILKFSPYFTRMTEDEREYLTLNLKMMFHAGAIFELERMGAGGNGG